MSRDPFKIQGPAIISFSGGRTSGYMLRRIQLAHGGNLPNDIAVCFANTGKEFPQTLDFVREVGERWGIHIVWLQYRFDADPAARWEIVGHNSAAKDGEPFKALIDSKGYLPNPVTRFCTIELKIRPARFYAESLGWTETTMAIGFRADEAGRVSRARARARAATGKDGGAVDGVYPLHAAGITKPDVSAFWRLQDFDLRLPNANGKTPMGNCSLCFLKGSATIMSIMRDYPDEARFWIEAEAQARRSKPDGALFRADRASYAAMFKAVQDQRTIDLGDDADRLSDCFCTADE